MKKSKFKKILTVYIFILIILMVFFLLYILNSLVLFQNNQVDSYINNTIKKLNKASENNKLSDYIDYSNIEKSNLEDKNITIEEGFANTLKNPKIKYVEVDSKSEKELNYNVLINGKPLFNIKIQKGRKVSRIGLLNFNILNTKKIKLLSDRGIYYYDIKVPNNFKVTVNGHQLNNTHITTEEINKEFEKISYNTIPNNVVYKIDGLLKKPKIKIYNNNEEEVKHVEKDFTITNMDFYKTDDSEVAMKKLIAPIDILSLSEKWSLFLTKDLVGQRYGFNQLEKYLIKNSNMWNIAYAWATGIDITFTSRHTLKNPTFTNEKLSNFIIYNEKSFSCVVSLEKNMIVEGKTKVDRMNDRLYFIYYDDTNDQIDNPSWKLVDMKYIGKE